MMMVLAAMAFAAAASADDADPWQVEPVCAWQPGMTSIAVVPARTRKVWSGISYRIEGLVEVDGKETPFSDLVKDAEGAPWAAEGTMTFKGHTYAKYGLPRILEAGDTVPIGDRDGVAITAMPGAAAVPEVVYIMNRGLLCEFQPYELKG